MFRSVNNLYGFSFIFFLYFALLSMHQYQTFGIGGILVSSQYWYRLYWFWSGIGDIGETSASEKQLI
jgi:hypothetical protein